VPRPPTPRGLDDGGRQRPSQKNASLPPVVATLTPGLLRGTEQPPTVSVKRGVPYVLLRATVPENKYPDYSADLRTTDTRVAWRWPARKPQANGTGATVSFTVPAGVLVEDFYYLTLYGVPASGKAEKVDIYPFNVERR
jgi:hypothetical protein